MSFCTIVYFLVSDAVVLGYNPHFWPTRRHREPSITVSTDPRFFLCLNYLVIEIYNKKIISTCMQNFWNKYVWNVKYTVLFTILSLELEQLTLSKSICHHLTPLSLETVKIYLLKEKCKWIKNDAKLTQWSSQVINAWSANCGRDVYSSFLFF